MIPSKLLSVVFHFPVSFPNNVLFLVLAALGCIFLSLTLTHHRQVFQCIMQIVHYILYPMIELCIKTSECGEESTQREIAVKWLVNIYPAAVVVL